MGKKQRKNSNYVTEKTIQAKLEKEKLKRKKKIKKVVKQVAIGVAVVVAVIAFIWLITFLANIDLSSKGDIQSTSTGTSGFGSTSLKADDSYLNEIPDDQKFEATHHVTMVIEGYEKYPITIELYGNEAPETVENFIKLVDAHFYDGLTFHRAVDGFMLQGGGYDVSGNEVEADTIKGEFSENGVDNPIKHLAGVISMARTSVKDSASSQFFIVDETSANNTTSLDGKYAAFGRVTDGLEVINDICNKAKSEIIEIGERPIIKSITYHSHADGEHHH